MRKILTRSWVHTMLLLALLAGAVFVRIHDYKWSRGLSTVAFDHYNVARPRLRSDKIIIVDIDDDSLARFGQWPWPRTYIADLVLNLKKMGAASVSFDGVLAEPDRTSPEALIKGIDNEEMRSTLAKLPQHDQVLADAIRETGFFAAGFSFGSYQQARKPRIVMPVLAKKDVRSVMLAQARHFTNTATFIPMLEDAAAGNGSFMADPETDGILRKTGMIFSDGTSLYPSLAIEAVRLSLPGPRQPVKIVANSASGLSGTQYTIEVGPYHIPVDQDGSLRVYFRTMERDRDYVSAYQVLQPEFYQAAQQKVVGRIVLIGSSAEGLKDVRSTPLSLFIPGVEIHANAIEQILQGRYLQRPFLLLRQELLFMIFIGLTIIFLAPFIGAVTLAAVTAVLIAGMGILSWTMFLQRGLLLDPAYPSLSILALFGLASLLAYIRTESERKHVKTAFSHYISPDFMKELTANPDRLKLGGEVRDLSVMFTDIRGFTGISEKLPPEDLIHLMNDFLTPMSALVMDNRGTIDKYMGDAMMAFWNAPLDDPDHARHACLTALKMNAALGPLNETLRDRGIALAAGIGVHSGPASVGNMGSRQRFAYSALGDTVNLASRLEGQTKAYGVSVLISEATAMQVADLAVLELDLLRVKGKSAAARIYTVIGDTGYAATAEFKALKANHDAMLLAYRARQFDRAEALLAGCVGACLAMDEFYLIFSERIRSLKLSPPGPDWDGVYAALSK